MRIFTDLIEAYQEIERDLHEVGIWIRGHSVQDQIVKGNPDYDFAELSPYLWCFTQPGNTSKWNDLALYLNLNTEWLNAEHRERMCSLHDRQVRDNLMLNPGKAWKLRAEVWEPFIEKKGQHKGQFAYTYANRFATAHQLWRVQRELIKNPGTRQAIVSNYAFVLDSRNIGGAHRTPCSMFYHFMVRDYKLNLHYVMRSCDFFTHFPYDVLLAVKMLNTMAATISYPVGVFTHFVTSLHGFRKDFSPGVF